MFLVAIKNGVILKSSRQKVIVPSAGKQNVAPDIAAYFLCTDGFVAIAVKLLWT